MRNYSRLVGIENQYRQDYTALAVHGSGTGFSHYVFGENM